MTRGWQAATRPQSFSARLATWSSRHRYVVIAAWLCVSLIGAGLWAFVGTDTDIEQPPRGEAGEALQLFEERFGRDGAPVREFVVFSHDELRITDGHGFYEQAVTDLLEELGELRVETTIDTGGVPTTISTRVVAETESFFAAEDSAASSPFVDRDQFGGDTTFAIIELQGDLEHAVQNVPLVLETVRQFDELIVDSTAAELRATHSKFCGLADQFGIEEAVCAPSEMPQEIPLDVAVLRDIRRRLADPESFPFTDPRLVSPADDLLVANSDYLASGGFEIAVGGEASLARQIAEIVDSDYNRSLYLDFAVAFVILALIFGALISASLPLLLAAITIIVSNGLLALISRGFPLSQMHVEVVLLLGLATGIDYAFFVMNRYRSEIALGRPREDALRIASGTAGKTVVFAGATVVLAAAGMFIVDDVLFNSLAVAVMVTVALTIILSLTLLPALLSLVGERIDKYRLPLIRPVTEEGGGVWGRLAERVLRQPRIIATATLLFLAVLATPLFFPQFNLGFNGVRAVSDEAEAKAALTTLSEHFTLGTALPAPLIIDFGAESVFDEALLDQVAQLVQSIEDSDEFGRIVEGIDTNDAGDTQVIALPIDADIGDDAAAEAINKVRSQIVPEIFVDDFPRVLVSGATAINVDFRDNIVFKTPFVFGYVFLVAFLVLLVMFRSVVIPLQAIFLNGLVVAASYGVLVLVFQEGWVLEWALDFEATGIVDSWIPLLIFAVLFGVSMNYHLFIMGRIKEAYERGASNDEAIAIGVRATAGTVTGAAAIMVAVLVVLSFSRSIGLKELGVGLGVAVLIDATLIRSVLLPASMKLLGDLNWYLPRWLAWIPGVRMGES